MVCLNRLQISLFFVAVVTSCLSPTSFPLLVLANDVEASDDSTATDVAAAEQAKVEIEFATAKAAEEAAEKEAVEKASAAEVAKKAAEKAAIKAAEEAAAAKSAEEAAATDAVEEAVQAKIAADEEAAAIKAAEETAQAETNAEEASAEEARQEEDAKIAAEAETAAMAASAEEEAAALKKSVTSRLTVVTDKLNSVAISKKGAKKAAALGIGIWGAATGAGWAMQYLGKGPTKD